MARKKTGEQGVTVYLDQQTYSALKMLSAGSGKSLNEILTTAIGDWWKKNPERAKWERLAKEAKEDKA